MKDRRLDMTDKQRMNDWCYWITYFRFLYSNSRILRIKNDSFLSKNLMINSLVISHVESIFLNSACYRKMLFKLFGCVQGL